jgi:hypothetical protein
VNTIFRLWSIQYNKEENERRGEKKGGKRR